MVKISVIVPVYNTENYLRECLDSIVNQTFDDIEIICINDGSTDSSLDILREYEESDKRISVVCQPNSGLSITRNHGIRLAKGDYIYFIDSDDYLELTALEELYRASDENNLDLLIFKLINFDDGTTNKYTSEYYEMESLKYLNGKVFNYADIGEDALNFAVSAPGKFYKRELIHDMKFPEKLIFEDNVFFAQAMLKAKRVSFYDKHLYNRRIRNDSITTTKTIKCADSIIIINKIIELSKEFDVYEQFKYGLAKKKIDSAYFRYSLVDDEFKEEFFKRVQNDFTDYGNEYEKDILPALGKTYNYIFGCFLNCHDHEEFDLKIKIFNFKKNNEKLKKQNKKLKKELDNLKKKNESIKSSQSWKITKPLRQISNSLKK